LRAISVMEGSSSHIEISKFASKTDINDDKENQQPNKKREGMTAYGEAWLYDFKPTMFAKVDEAHRRIERPYRFESNAVTKLCFAAD